MYYDDEEIRGSTSSREFLESPAKAKREALRNKLKKDGLKPKTDNLQGLKLQMLKQKMEGRKDAEQKRNNEKKDGKGSSVSTKTREQEIKARQQTADEKPSTDQMVKQGQTQAKAQEEMQKQEVATEEG
jgi:hypothetical protein